MLRLFKEFRKKSGSGDNQINLHEFNRALKACSIYMTDHEVKRLHAAMDTNGNGEIDQDEFSQFVIGRYDELGAASNSGASIGSIGANSESHRDASGTEWSFNKSQNAPGADGLAAAPARATAAVDMSIWVGNIPHNLCDEDTIKRAAEKCFGPVDQVSLRRKGADKPSWAMIVMHNHDDVTKAIIRGKLPCLDPEYGGTVDLKVQPVALKKNLGEASGALADVWRKTLSKTSHGKHLDVFRQKIEQNIEGGANSTLKLFKEFRSKAGSATNEITLAEFQLAVNKLNLGMTKADTEDLFRDIDMDHEGSIGMQEFELAILGRVGVLGRSDEAVFQKD